MINTKKKTRTSKMGIIAFFKGLSFAKIFKSGKFWMFVIIAILVTALYIRDLGMRNSIAQLETTVTEQKADLENLVKANKNNSQTIDQLIEDKKLTEKISKDMRDRLNRLSKVYDTGNQSIKDTANKEGSKKASATIREALKVVAEAKNNEKNNSDINVE